MSSFDISRKTNIVESKIHTIAFKYLKKKVKEKENKINYGEHLSCQQADTNLLEFFFFAQS